MRITAATLLAITAFAFAAPAPALPEGAPSAKPAEPILVDDFEAPALRPAWKSYRAKMNLVQGVNGKALEVVADEGSSDRNFSSVTVTLPAKDLRTVVAVSFQLQAAGMKFIQVLLRKDGSSRSLEEVMDPSPDWQEWKERVLPLRLMVEGSLRLLPDPADLDVLEFRWEGPGTIRLDDIRLRPGDRGDLSWKISEEDLLELAFGKGRGQILRGKHYSVLWEGSGVDKAELSRGLRDQEQFSALLASRWSLEPPTGTRIPILCAATSDRLTELRKKVSAEFQGWGSLPSQSSRKGLEPCMTATLEGLRVNDKFPNTEGLVHYIGRALGVDGYNSLQRVFGWACVRRLFPAFLPRDKNVDSSDFQRRLQGGSGPILTWKALLDERGAFQNFGQAASVAEFLAACHKPKLKAVWDGIRAIRIDPDDETSEAIAKALGMSIPELQEQWMRWGAANWK